MNPIKTSAFISPTNEFIYKNASYSFNLQIASLISKKIQKNLKKYKLCKKIPLLEKDKNTINLAESSINDFISFCQCQIILMMIKSIEKVIK